MWCREIIGHERPLRVLRRALEKGQVAQAYLFVGPEGVGKKTLALALAGALLCEEGEGGDLCHCKSCRKSKAGVHPDLCIVEPKGAHIVVEQIREIHERVAYSPIEGSRRVFVIDQAESMNPQSSNALLKVLEEPPRGNVFILISPSEAALLPTVVSRCQKIPFGPLKEEEVAIFLLKRRNWEEARAREVARHSQGSIGRALKLEDKPIGLWRREALEVLQGITRMDAWGLVETARAWSSDKGDVIPRLECLREVIRESIKEAIKGWSPVGNVAGSWFKGGPSLDVLLWLWKKVGRAIEGVERNFNPQLVIEDLLIELREKYLAQRGFGLAW